MANAAAVPVAPAAEEHLPYQQQDEQQQQDDPNHSHGGLGEEILDAPQQRFQLAGFHVEAGYQIHSGVGSAFVAEGHGAQLLAGGHRRVHRGLEFHIPLQQLHRESWGGAPPRRQRGGR